MTYHTFSLCYRKRCKKFGFSSSEESLATTPCSSSTEEEEAAEVQKRRRNRWNNAKSMTHYVIMYYIHVLLLIKLYSYRFSGSLVTRPLVYSKKKQGAA